VHAAYAHDGRHRAAKRQAVASVAWLGAICYRSGKLNDIGRRRTWISGGCRHFMAQRQRLIEHKVMAGALHDGTRRTRPGTEELMSKMPLLQDAACVEWYFGVLCTSAQSVV